ncbi:hypothetical protein J1N35_028596 [Gossypium stocksii]|uniref:Uncharacterized protein n=1 Tax=Gossypium stocksii TaxID=47602 RepID=A0A9D3ZS51_9ROSI|nr:hypothetical protein J1N35_028596 [Gossypium stocksii]
MVIVTKEAVALIRATSTHGIVDFYNVNKKTQNEPKDTKRTTNLRVMASFRTISQGKLFPPALHPIVNDIIDFYGGVSATRKMNPTVFEAIYITFYASLSVGYWRDATKDAVRINFKVDFTVEHLKKIACAYIGLMECRKLDNMGLRISN